VLYNFIQKRKLYYKLTVSYESIRLARTARLKNYFTSKRIKVHYYFLELEIDLKVQKANFFIVEFVIRK
jgi:hypothetical protein